MVVLVFCWVKMSVVEMVWGVFCLRVLGMVIVYFWRKCCFLRRRLWLLCGRCVRLIGGLVGRVVMLGFVVGWDGSGGVGVFVLLVRWIFVLFVLLVSCFFWVWVWVVMRFMMSYLISWKSFVWVSEVLFCEVW